MRGGVCTFTPEDRKKLMDELNMQLETNTFYNINMIRKKEVVTDLPGVELYRPLVFNEFNPFNKTPYNYAVNYSIPVHGIAFENNLEFKEWPHYKIYNSNEQNVQTTTYINGEMNVKGKANELEMRDLISKTPEENILEYSSVASKELSLVKVSKMRSFWFKEINIFETIKNIFRDKKRIF